MLALAATALALSAAAHPGYGDGVCVDVTIDGTTVADTLCPTPDDLAVRTLTAKGNTVYFGVSDKPLTLTFRRRTLKAPAGPYAVAVKGAPVLGAIRAGKRHRDLDVFGLPGKQAGVLHLRDEVNRKVRLVAAVPRGRTLCTGIRLPSTPSPGRTLCHRKENALLVRFSAKCDAHRELLYGIAPRRIARATAVLANGRTAPVRVTPVPKRLGKPAVVLSARLTGRLATAVRGYDAGGKLLATASLDAACSPSKTRSKMR